MQDFIISEVRNGEEVEPYLTVGDGDQSRLTDILLAKKGTWLFLPNIGGDLEELVNSNISDDYTQIRSTLENQGYEGIKIERVNASTIKISAE